MTDRPIRPRPGPERRALPERRARERRVLWLGLMISALVHLVALGWVGGWLEPDPTPAPRRAEIIVAEPPGGLRAIEIAEPSATDRPPEPDTPDRPEPAEETETMVATAEVPVVVPADSISAADRLSPRVIDPRLWEPMVILPLELSIEDVEARVGAAIELLSDSALAEAEAAVRARDWTVEDGSGGKWGISPGKLHLGKVTLPLPIWIPLDVDATLEQQRWYGLDRDLERARILDSFEERVKAIRERRDRERTERLESERSGLGENGEAGEAGGGEARGG